MISLILSSLIVAPQATEPTKIIGSAATMSKDRKTLSVTQPQNYIQILTSPPTSPQVEKQTIQQNAPKKDTLSSQTQNLIANQTSTIYPKDLNPLDYENKIENTIYQIGDRLIIIQSIPLKYIKKALTPNIDPTITDYPTL